MRGIRTPGLTGILCAAAAGLAMASFASPTTVHSVTELTNVLANVKANDEVVIAEGTYNLAGMKMHAVGHLYVTNTITLRGGTGNPADVVLQPSRLRPRPGPSAPASLQAVTLTLAAGSRPLLAALHHKSRSLPLSLER